MDNEKRIGQITYDEAPRPSFSRFEQNLQKGGPLPIFTLATPAEAGAGVLLVGDYIAQDFISYAQINIPSFRDRWIVMTTTQSDAIPTDCVDADFNFFSNKRRVGDYLKSAAGQVPFSTELADAHYVDENIFKPDNSYQKEWDIFYAAKWYPTKMTELLIESAKINPSLKVGIYGWPVVSERKIHSSMQYRDMILDLSKGMSNVQIFDSGFDLDKVQHVNKDGSFVIGDLTKEQMRDMFFRRAKSTVFLSEKTEAVNRSCAEMLSCDVPVMVAPTDGGMEDLVTSVTGVMIDRSPEGIVSGYQSIVENNGLSPRNGFLQRYGREKANKRMAEIIEDVAKTKGLNINISKLRKYGGDLWTNKDSYLQIF